MANIYLRVSRYVAAFMRATGDGQSMPPSQPVEFSRYTQEYVTLTNGLRIIPEQQQSRASCYSQIAWQNMLRGRMPQGGKPIILRNPDDYLTYSEICTLEALPNKTRSEAYEFLCIALPREVCIDGTVIRVHKSYTLDTRAANDLRGLLRDTFIRVFYDFDQRNRIFAQSQGFHRSDTEILERFLAEYNVPVSHDKKERNTLRRLVRRWRKEASYLVQSPTIIGDDLVTRIDEHERRGGLPSYDND